MRKIMAVFTAFLITLSIAAQNDSAFYIRERYIATYREIAIDKMREFKIPASITLAQGVLESGAGRSDLARYANNHFGIKCHKGWEGDYFIKDDDAKGECFRKYNKADESFRDHSLFLTSRAHYAPLFKLDISDYKGWAYGLKAAGYATNPNYPQLLLKIIEEHKLYAYDSIGLNLEPKPDSVSSHDFADEPDVTTAAESNDMALQRYRSGPSDRQVFLKNGIKCVVAQPGDTYIALSVNFKLSLEDIYRFNDLVDGAMLKSGDVVYIQKKAKRTEHDFHIVRPGETLHSIAQLYGIRLTLLERRNSLNSRDTLTPGDKIWLNYRKIE